MREWYVFKVGKRHDPNQPRVAVVQDVPRAVRARDARRGRAGDPPGAPGAVEAFLDDVADVAPAQPAPDPGYGARILREDMREMNLVFTTEEAAHRYAKEQAELNPKTLFGVYSCVAVFETTKPEVIAKKFSDTGELLVVSE